jgi:hypothetical protein
VVIGRGGLMGGVVLVLVLVLVLVGGAVFVAVEPAHGP